MSDADSGKKSNPAAEQLLRQLQANYLAELPERVSQLEQMAMGLGDEGDFTERFNEFYRKVHSLKGTAGTYGVHIVTKICHQLEERLNALSGTKPADMDVFLDGCLAYIDIMTTATQMIVEGRADYTSIEAKLAALQDSDAKASDETRAASVKHLRGLLVESSKVNNALYLNALKSLPIDFTIIDDGYGSLQLLLEEHYDVLITGYETRGLNGAALIAAVRLSEGVNQYIHAILVRSGTHGTLPDYVAPNAVIRRDADTAEQLFKSLEIYLLQRPEQRPG